MSLNEIDLRSEEDKKEEYPFMQDTLHDEYAPIQQNSTLFKFLLYTIKVEIKANSMIKMIYHTSLYEIGIWLVGFFIFIANPSQMFYILCLVLHLPRSSLGFLLLKCMPKTYEIIEDIAKKPDFDEDKLIQVIQAQIRQTFIAKWADHKLKFLLYFIATLVCTTIDLVVLIVMIVIFGSDQYILVEICLLFITIALLACDVVYFLWFFTLKFSFPPDIIDPINKAIFGSINDLIAFAMNKLQRQGTSTSPSVVHN